MYGLVILFYSHSILSDVKMLFECDSGNDSQVNVLRPEGPLQRSIYYRRGDSGPDLWWGFPT